MDLKIQKLLVCSNIDRDFYFNRFSELGYINVKHLKKINENSNLQNFYLDKGIRVLNKYNSNKTKLGLYIIISIISNDLLKRVKCVFYSSDFYRDITVSDILDTYDLLCKYNYVDDSSYYVKYEVIRYVSW